MKLYAEEVIIDLAEVDSETKRIYYLSHVSWSSAPLNNTFSA